MAKAFATIFITLILVFSTSKAALSITCEDATKYYIDYKCLDSKPLGAGTSSVAYGVALKNCHEGDCKKRVLKISTTDFMSAIADPEIFNLKALKDAKYVVHLLELPTVKIINDEKYLFEVLEYAEHGDLEHFIESNPTYFDDNEKLLDFALLMIRGLQEIHDRGIIHASIKPQNTIVMDDMSPKYIDFNWAVKVNSNNRSRGDHLYNAPEIVDRASSIDWTPAQDIYSLGVLFYYLVHHDVPFNGLTRSLHIRAVRRGIFYFKKGISVNFFKIIISCLRKEPKDRVNLDELRQLLHDALKEQEPITRYEVSFYASLESTEPLPAGSVGYDHLYLAIAGGISVAILLLVVGVFVCVNRVQKRSSNRDELYAESEL